MHFTINRAALEEILLMTRPSSIVLRHAYMAGAYSAQSCGFSLSWASMSSTPSGKVTSASISTVVSISVTVSSTSMTSILGTLFCLAAFIGIRRLEVDFLESCCLATPEFLFPMSPRADLEAAALVGILLDCNVPAFSLVRAEVALVEAILLSDLELLRITFKQ